MPRIALCLATLLAVLPGAHAQRPGPPVRPPVRAVDGDTLALGPKRIRMIGLDAPELHGACKREIAQARAARARLAALIAPGIILRPRGRDRYGRTLAVVQDRRGRDLAQVMIEEGLARPYTGRGRRGGWC